MNSIKILITGGSGFIGTNLIDLLLSQGYTDIANFDKQKPIKENHLKYWAKGNILVKEDLASMFASYKPTHVVHLAAKTDTASEILEDYVENTEGTANVLAAVKDTPSIITSVITSTQYVYKSDSNPTPLSDTDFKPHTTYGISKMITEKLTREANLASNWVIIRPTNVWGEWNMRYPNELLKIIDKGWYFQTSGKNPVKSYAYVQNVVGQIVKMLFADAALIDKQVYYVGDYPMESSQWINAFSLELTGKIVKEIPYVFMKGMAITGDLIRKTGFRFPLSSLRLNNMIDSYLTPMKKTIDKFGLPHPDNDANVCSTINWLKGEGKPYFPYWKDK